MAVVTLLCICLVRNLSVERVSKKQLILETAVGGMNHFFEEIIGKEGKRYIPYLMSVGIYIGIANLIGLLGFKPPETAVGGMNHFFEEIIGKEGKRYIPYLMSVGIYIGIANLIGLLGFKPPTKDLNVTAALAIMSIILIEYAGFRQKGLKKWVKSFAEPMPIIAPINILEIFIKPLSLCMRLFGNVLGSFVVMELIKIILPVLLPIPFSFYFDIFDGLIQAYVFVFLTSLFIKEAME